MYENNSNDYLFEQISFDKLISMNLISLINQLRNFNDYLEEKQKQEELLYEGQLESSVNTLSDADYADYAQEISPTNKLVLEVIIAPKSVGIIMFEHFHQVNGIWNELFI